MEHSLTTIVTQIVSICCWNMSKSLVDTCIYETYWSIKLLPYANISTDVTDISTNIISVSLLNFTDIKTHDSESRGQEEAAYATTE